MPVERHFLGWNKAFTLSVSDFLLCGKNDSPINLEREIVVVPTRQAGRRLREALAVSCEELGTTLFPPVTVEPSFFLKADSNSAPASPTVVSAAWCRLLLDIDPREYSGFFPGPLPEKSASWAVRTGELIQSLRNELSDGGLTIGELVASRGANLEEPERWQNLAVLERMYLEKIEGLGMQDPCVCKINRAKSPCLEEEVERITLAGTPDPPGLVVMALESLSIKAPIRVLIHAPEEYAEHFDMWGRPVPGKWREEEILIPEERSNLIPCADPGDQAAKVVSLLREESPGNADLVSLAVPDRSLIPFLDTELSNHGLSAFDPADQPVSGHPLWRLIERVFDLLREGGYTSVAAYLRHPYALDHLCQTSGLTAGSALKEMDSFQNEHLPLSFTEMADLLLEHPATGQNYPAFAEVIRRISQQLKLFADLRPEEGLRRFLSETLSTYAPDGASRRKEFINVASAIDDVLHEFSEDAASIVEEFDGADRLELLAGRLSNQTYRSDRGDALLDMEGWLELTFNPAPFLVVTGMNEGFVPDTRMEDVFLPDAFRKELNLRNDETRLARDAFIMKTLIESHRKNGRAVFLTGRTSAQGDPLKPSRLLFRCSDSELVDRASRLFAHIPSRRMNCPHSISFPLNPNFPELLKESSVQRQLSVTAFRDYLACPFRFYLKHVLGMEKVSDEKTGPDALDFGLLVHHALRKMAENEEYRCCGDETELSDFLARNAEAWVIARYGKSCPLPVTIALDAAIQRLKAAASRQAELLDEGWEIIRWEQPCEVEVSGLKIKGQIDRVDRHRETGALRVLDYKTIDQSRPPEREHIKRAGADTPEYMYAATGKKKGKWVDLQLPLYVKMFAETGGMAGSIEPGYFNLPKAVTETGVMMWRNFSDDVEASAVKCAEGVIRRIQEGIFWPPSETPGRMDDFSNLFYGSSQECFVPIKQENS